MDDSLKHLFCIWCFRHRHAQLEKFTIGKNAILKIKEIKNHRHGAIIRSNSRDLRNNVLIFRVLLIFASSENNLPRGILRHDKKITSKTIDYRLINRVCRFFSFCVLENSLCQQERLKEKFFKRRKLPRNAIVQTLATKAAPRNLVKVQHQSTVNLI